MKITLDINDELLIKANALSAREHKSLTALIEEGLRLNLRRAPAKSRRCKGVAHLPWKRWATERNRRSFKPGAAGCSQ